MAYETTIRCDVRKGNPLEKLRCHSDGQAKQREPLAESGTSRAAVFAAEQAAKDMGRNRVRRPSRTDDWVCPACQN
jgi:hypothetical protein